MAVTEGNDGTETGCVHFVRGRVVEVTDWPIHPSEEGKLIIRAEDTLAGFVRRIPVDMVVLSVGLEPQSDARDVRRMFNISCSEQKKRANIRSDTLLIDRLLFYGRGTPEPYKVKPRIHRSVRKVAAISSPNLVTPVTDFLEQLARRLRMRGNIFSRLHGGVLWLPKLNSPA
jgi:hypothetical protein